ncbi:MAG: biotin/lipoyl-binding protein, partial [Bacteroidota bacterium]
MLKYSLPLLASLLLLACQSPTLTYDASGTFEAEEVIISAEANGKILTLAIEEGKELQAGEIIGHIDSIQLVLKKKQVEASISAILSRRPDIAAQLAGIETQIATANQERTRVEKLLAAEAATPKQLDDLNAQIRVLEKQLSAQRSALATTTKSLSSETRPLAVQLEQLDDQLRRTKIVNP